MKKQSVLTATCMGDPTTLNVSFFVGCVLTMVNIQVVMAQENI